VRIVWLRAAELNLEEQLEYIRERNPPAADRLADKIATTVARLADHPRRGRPGRVAGTRELVVPSTPYIVVYMVERDYVRTPPCAARRAALAAAATTIRDSPATSPVTGFNSSVRRFKFGCFFS